MENDKEFLGREPVSKLLLRLALPTVVSQVVNMLYNIVDRIYIGHIPENGALALTGIGVCMPLIMAISAFASLVCSGGAPKASIEMGRKDYDKAEHILGNCLMMLLILSAALTAVLLIFHRPLLMMFGASDKTIEYAESYMQIYAIGTVFVQLTLGLNMFITTQGFAKTGMMTVLIGAVLNIILDPVFIFGLDMGVKGAALATVISQAVSGIWCVVFLSSRKSYLRIRKDKLRLRAKIILPCLALGLATFIMYITESVISVCFNSSLLKYGGDIAVGAMTICTSIMQFAMLPMQGIGQGAQPIASYNYGAKNAGRVKAIFVLLLKVDMIIAIVLYLAIMMMPTVFARIFSDDAVLIAYTANVVRIYCAGMFLFGIQMSCQILLTSIGNAPCSIIVALVRKIVLLIPLIYLMPRLGVISNKAYAVYMAEPVADIIAVIFTVIVFYFQLRKSLNKISNVKVGTEA